MDKKVQYCGHCGKQVLIPGKYCGYCGEELNLPKEPEIIESEKPQITPINVTGISFSLLLLVSLFMPALRTSAFVNYEISWFDMCLKDNIWTLILVVSLVGVAVAVYGFVSSNPGVAFCGELMAAALSATLIGSMILFRNEYLVSYVISFGAGFYLYIIGLSGMEVCFFLIWRAKKNRVK